MKKLYKLGTRGSALARTQSQWVADQLMFLEPEIKVELVIIKTTGDMNQTDPLGTLGGKGVFTREIEQAVLAGEIDFAVHSLKDLPTTLPEGLILGCTPAREDCRDALVGHLSLHELPPGAVVGTGSLRRQIQLKALRPDLEFKDIRGNVPTRIEKWRRGDYSGGVVLAMAGLARLGKLSGASAQEIHPLSVEDCIPAPCQGILGIECREGDTDTLELLNQFQDVTAQLESVAERAFLAALGGGCDLPAAALARVSRTELKMVAAFQPEGGTLQRLHLDGEVKAARLLGSELARRLREGAPC